MKYKLELNLKQMAMTSKAISIWEQEDIKNKVQSFYMSSSPSNNEERWHLLIKEVISKLDAENLPSIFKSKISYIASAIGLKTFNWIKYIKKELHYGSNYTEQICWTQYGTIDKLAIFKLWLDNKKLTISSLYEFACNYCLEEYTNNLWEQIPEQNKAEPYIYREYKYNLIAYWKGDMASNLSMLIKYSKRFGSDDDKIYDVNHSVEENMFRLSVLEGNELGVKYFWNRLNKDEKERNLKKSAIAALEDGDKHYPMLKDSYIDIFTFLMAEMGEEERIGLFQECKNSILRVYLLHWPWEGLFMSTLEQMWHYFTEEDYEKLICNITLAMYANHKLNSDAAMSRYQDVLHEVWSKSPAHLKQTIDMENVAWDRMLSDLFVVEDIQSISMIINDKDLTNIRQKLIDQGASYYNRLMKKEQHELLEKFVQEVLLNEEERDGFKKKICESTLNIFYDYIYKDKYELVEKLLKWGFKTEAEQMVFKAQICERAATTCYYFIARNRYELAEKFLNWWGKTEEDNRLFKKDLIYRHEKWCSDKIKLTWCANSEDIITAKERSEQFLNWCLDSKVEINSFKKEIFNTKCAKAICRSLIDGDHYEIIEDFLAWCLLSVDEIKKFKEMLISATLWKHCDRLILDGHDVDKASNFIDWCFDKEEEKQEFLKKFMSPSYSDHNPIYLCSSFIKDSSYIAKYEPTPTQEDKLKKFKDFINVWLGSSEVREEFKDKFKTYIDSYYQNNRREVDVDHQMFANLLENWDQVNEQMKVASLGEANDVG